MNFLKRLYNVGKPKVTFSSTVEGLEKISPILPANKVLPQWFKDIKESGVTEGNNKIPLYSNFKSCPGFIDFAMQGYVVPLWCDVHLNVNLVKGIQWRTPCKEFTFEFHGDDQYKNYLPEHAKRNTIGVLKPWCPWRLFTPKGYSVYQLPMTYEFNEIFEVMSGTIHTDMYHEINQQMVLKKEGEFLIPKGTPLAVYIPYKRQKYDFECITQTEELKKRTRLSELSTATKFIKRFRNIKDIISGDK